MDFPAHIRQGRIVMSPQIAALWDNYVRRLKDDTQLTVRLMRVVPGKTHQQVKTHWGLVIGTIRREFENRGMDLATFLGSPSIPDGLEVPADVIQAVLYATCNDVGEHGERKTLSKMTTIEASMFFEKCRNYAASAWNIEIMDPDPLWREVAAATANATPVTPAPEAKPVARCSAPGCNFLYSQMPKKGTICPQCGKRLGFKKL